MTESKISKLFGVPVETLRCIQEGLQAWINERNQQLLHEARQEWKQIEEDEKALQMENPS